MKKYLPLIGELNMDLADVEGENVLSNIFKDAFQDSCDDNPELSQYLSELSSYGITRLNSEPYRLAEEKAQILEETRSLAFHNYKTFIQTADCCKEIFEDFQIIETHVESVLHKVPELTNHCKTFLKEAQDINASRKTNNLTMQKYPQLLELLELPQLVDTCVRNEYYEETLEIAEYVKRLEKKHSNIPIMQKIVEEVKVNMQLMFVHLLQQLRSNIQLPACLKVLGYLRRMNIFTEVQLRVKFLQARDAWFNTVLHAIPKEDSYQHISKTIEVSRVHLFDIITQYRAIFSDDEITAIRDTKVNEAALFHSWVLQKISQFLTTLEEGLLQGVGSRLDSLFGQCMYFGLSFGRVGADFRALVVPIFQGIILKNFEFSIVEADTRLHDMFQSYTLLGSQSIPSNVLSTHLYSMKTTQSLQPPMSLLEFPPLANYCNQLLNALNDLRVCASYALVCDVTEGVALSLARAVEFIVAFHRLDETTFNDQETEKFGIMCKCFASDLVPHINRCLQHLFSPQLLSMLIGTSVTEHAKTAKLGELDVSGITEPLLKFIPAPLLIPEDFILESNNLKNERDVSVILNTFDIHGTFAKKTEQQENVSSLDGQKINKLIKEKTTEESISHLEDIQPANHQHGSDNDKYGDDDDAKLQSGDDNDDKQHGSDDNDEKQHGSNDNDDKQHGSDDNNEYQTSSSEYGKVTFNVAVLDTNAEDESDRGDNDDNLRDDGDEENVKGDITIGVLKTTDLS